MADMLVCRWSSTRLSGASSVCAPLALHDGVGLQHHVAGEAVDVQLALDEQVLALLHPVHNGLALVPGEELVHPHRAGVVGHVEADHPGAPLFQLPVVHGEHVALHHDGAHVQLQAAHGDGLLFDLVAAIEQLGPGRAAAGLLLPGAGGLEPGQGLPPDLLRPPEGGLGIIRRGGSRRAVRRHRRGRHPLQRRRLRYGGRWGRGRFPRHVQLHLLHPVGQGQASLNLPPQPVVRQAAARHLRPDGTGRLVDHRPGHQVLIHQSGQLLRRTPGGEQPTLR